MKLLSVLLITGLCLASRGVKAQSPACCARPSGFMALATTEDFARAHEAPAPFQLEKPRGNAIKFKTLDGKDGSAYYVPAQEATVRVLIVFHEWWGLNDYIRREAERLQDSLGPVDVYAIDLYDGAVATTPEEAGKLSSGLDRKRAEVLIKGLLAKIGRDEQVATIGWCMGGTYAFRGAVLAGSQASGCVMYYGFPEKDGKEIAPVKTDVLYVRATQDKFISESDVRNFGQTLEGAGRKFTLINVAADHAFANPSNPHFDAANAAASEQKSLAFLRRYLQL